MEMYAEELRDVKNKTDSAATKLSYLKYFEEHAVFLSTKSRKKIWDTLPDDIRDASSLNIFKK